MQMRMAEGITGTRYNPNTGQFERFANPLNLNSNVVGGGGVSNLSEAELSKLGLVKQEDGSYVKANWGAKLLDRKYGKYFKNTKL